MNRWGACHESTPLPDQAGLLKKPLQNSESAPNPPCQPGLFQPTLLGEGSGRGERPDCKGGVFPHRLLKHIPSLITRVCYNTPANTSCIFSRTPWSIKNLRVRSQHAFSLLRRLHRALVRAFRSAWPPPSSLDRQFFGHAVEINDVGAPPCGFWRRELATRALCAQETHRNPSNPESSPRRVWAPQGFPPSLAGIGVGKRFVGGTFFSGRLLQKAPVINSFLPAPFKSSPLLFEPTPPTPST